MRGTFAQIVQTGLRRTMTQKQRSRLVASFAMNVYPKKPLEIVLRESGPQHCEQPET